MKRTYIAILLLAVTLSAFSQQTMVTHLHDGTKEYRRCSSVDSVTFEPFIAVAGGTFTAGVTTVTISSFKMDMFEITYELWTAVRAWGLVHGYTDLVTGQNGYNPVGTNNPVMYVNWYDIIKWCNARSEKDGLNPIYYTTSSKNVVYKTGQAVINNDAVDWTANGYRLPTEAEWEFAAKGGTLKHSPVFTYSGSNTVGGVAWYSTNSGNKTHSVGAKLPNELGIYDMSGNVWEWCWDWYDGFIGIYPYGGTTDPKGPSTTQTYRVLRGGSFFNPDYNCQVVDRDGYSFPLVRDDSYGGFGFRCVLQ